MNLASISENKDREKRIAVTPEIAKKYISLGFNLSLPSNYGYHLGFSNEEYKTVDDVKNSWETIKAKEKETKSGALPHSLLEDIPSTLPGMTRSVKLQKRAARVGFDWPEISMVFDKLDEELSELREEIEQKGSSDRLLDEMGDVMFVIANLARHLKIDPEQASRAGNQKFTSRFNDMEKQAKASGKDMGSLTLVELETMWQSAKTKGL